VEKVVQGTQTIDVANVRGIEHEAVYSFFFRFGHIRTGTCERPGDRFATGTFTADRHSTASQHVFHTGRFGPAQGLGSGHTEHAQHGPSRAVAT
jgi:hypothetical protein